MSEQLLVMHEGKLIPIDLHPALIGSNYDGANHVAEKLQRGELTAKEIADYIGRELGKGMKKMAIAKAFRKSPAFISQHVTLLDLPVPVADAFNTGRVKDVTLVNELVSLLRKKPQDVTDWLSRENQKLTRSSVKQLREFLAGKDKCEKEKPFGKARSKAKDASSMEKPSSNTDDRPVGPDKLKKAFLKVLYNNRPARLIMNRRPLADGYAWLKYEDDGHEFEASLLEVRLTGVTEG